MGVNFVFSITGLAVAGIAACEIGLMHTDSIERFGALMRWGHVPFVCAGGRHCGIRESGFRQRATVLCLAVTFPLEIAQ
jgi:hypothetical protein